MSLEAFAAFVQELFPVTGWHERESSNYYRGCYWCGDMEEREIELCWLDSRGFDDYIFWLVVFSKKKRSVDQDAADEQFVDAMARIIASKGFTTLIPEDDITEKGNQNGVKYEGAG